MPFFNINLFSTIAILSSNTLFVFSNLGALFFSVNAFYLKIDLFLNTNTPSSNIIALSLNIVILSYNACIMSSSDSLSLDIHVLLPDIFLSTCILPLASFSLLSTLSIFFYILQSAFV